MSGLTFDMVFINEYMIAADEISCNPKSRSFREFNMATTNSSSKWLKDLNQTTGKGRKVSVSAHRDLI